ncbi:MAG TPA: protein phosphatase 2C domain-containing protein [Candidatus Coprocola pullicola]|nr:protein phosphatase 2C domain-containing protein [Candidatus Coprocola pullicola]
MQQIVLFCFFIVILIVLLLLIVIKLKLSYGLKSDSKEYAEKNFKIGNMQLLGNCQQQNDYFAIEQDKDTVFTVIADGLTDLPSGKFASVIAVETMKYNYHHMINYSGLLDYFKQSFQDIEESMSRNITGNKIGVAVLCGMITGKTLKWAAIGGCSLYLYRKGEIFSVNNNASTDTAMEYGSIKCKKKDVLLFCTEGIYKGVSELELKEILSKKEHSYKKAMLLSRIIQQKGYTHQKNATAIIIEI